MMEKVSVIIPIYNAEKFLSLCLESIINQTYKNLEIVLVNDGSLDNSIEICRQYAERDNRIKIIDDKNRGVSYARNKGIEKATGQYILFIDSDDIVKKNYIDILVKKINKNTNLDMAVCAYEEVNLNCNKKKNYNIDNSKIALLTGSLKKDYYLIREFLNTPWGKLYKTQIIKKHNIRFPDKCNIAEDQIFNYQYYLYVKEYIYINEPLYVYMHRKNSSLGTLKNEKTFSYDILNFKMKKNFLKTMQIENEEKILSDWAVVLINKYTTIDMNDSYKKFRKRMKIICEIFPTRILWGLGLKKFLATLFLKYNIFFPFYLRDKIKNKRYNI